MPTQQLSSRIRSIGRLAGTFTAAAVLVVASGSAAWSVPSDDAFARLLELNPGLSAVELEGSMHEAAAVTGLTYEQAITTALEEAERHAGPDGSAGAASSSNPSCGQVEIGQSRYKGDIFWASASTYGVPHGHVGIYSEKTWITEARGSGQNSGEFYYSGRKYCKKIEKMDVNTTITVQNTAADYASRYLIGKPYNSNFAWNKGGNINTLNCSELVYKAYKRSVNIDLDGDGGLGVYPSDIKNDSQTRTYQTIS